MEDINDFILFAKNVQVTDVEFNSKNVQVTNVEFNFKWLRIMVQFLSGGLSGD